MSRPSLGGDSATVAGFPRPAGQPLAVPQPV